MVDWIDVKNNTINGFLWLPKQIDTYVLTPNRDVLPLTFRNLLHVNNDPAQALRAWIQPNSRVRMTVDFALTYAAPATAGLLVGLEKATGFDGVKPLADFYTKHPLEASLATTGGLVGIYTALDVAGSVVTNAYGAAATRVQTISRNIPEVVVAGGLLLGLLGASLTGGKPAAQPVTVQDLETRVKVEVAKQINEVRQGLPQEVRGQVDQYLAQVVKPEVDKAFSDFSGQEREEISAYVVNTVPGIINETLKGKGYVTSGDVNGAINRALGVALVPYVQGAELNKRLSDVQNQIGSGDRFVDSLSARITALQQATPPPQPTPPPKAGLDQYSLYRVPVNVLRSVAQRDASGLAGILGLTVPTLQARLNGSNSNDELVLVQVGGEGVRMIQEDQFGKWRAFDFKPDNRYVNPTSVTGYFGAVLTPTELR
ncbi:MAG: hypothetical protein AABX60_03880, partial [Nanoarchaeota archaeon]